MSQKTSDFIFSFGFMVLGVGLLFFGSIYFGATNRSAKVNNIHFPIAGARFDVGGDINTVILPVSRPVAPLPKNDSDFSLPLTAVAAVAVDGQTNSILFKKNYDSVRSLASISKLMSAIVLSDLPIKWSSTTIITDDDADSSSHHLNIGEKFTLDDLWHVALIGSSNSAINALVRASGLTEEQFTARMNAKAVALHLSSLRFVEPTGLDNRNMGTPIDIARLLSEAVKIDKIYHTLQIPEYYADPLNKDKKRRVWNTNLLLTNWVPNNFNKDMIVGKTGYINDSGYNFVVQLTGKNKHAIRVVVMGAATNEARFSEARDIAEWIFNHYLWPEDQEYPKLVE